MSPAASWLLMLGVFCLVGAVTWFVVELTATIERLRDDVVGDEHCAGPDA